MKHTKLLVVALLVALMACLAMTAMADELYWAEDQNLYVAPTCYKPGRRVMEGWNVAPGTLDASGNPVSRYVVRQEYVEIPATNAHVWQFDVNKPDKPATCTDKGEVYAHCKNTGCPHIDTTQVIYTPALGHDFSDANARKLSDGRAATCTENGYEPIIRCARCDAFKNADNDGSVIPALGHDFDGAAWTVVNEATCAKEGKSKRVCKNIINGVKCTAEDYTAVPKNPVHTYLEGTKAFPIADNKNGYADNDTKHWNLVINARPATCTEAGCNAQYKCPTCGALKGGESRPAKGHNPNVTWTIKQEPTCAQIGIAVRLCTNTDFYGNVCGAEIERTTLPKTTYHCYHKVGEAEQKGNYSSGNAAAMPMTKADFDKASDVDKEIWAFITPGQDATCTTPKCTPVYRCRICGQTVGGTSYGSALGHKWAFAKDSKGKEINGKDAYAANCINDGMIKNECTECHITETIKLPAHGHYANWVPQKGTDATRGFTIWELRCVNPDCPLKDGILGTQVVNNGEKAPSGTVTTGYVSSTSTVKASSSASGTTITNGTATKTATASTKTSTTKSTAKSTASTASTKTAAAPATTETKKVATVAAVAAPAAELEANQAQLVADKHLYVVKNVAGEEIVLTVNVADGKITVEAALAEGESLVLYANAEAIENPTAENTLVLTANEAVELPEAFANAIVAVVKTESLPTAVAAK